MSESTLLTEKEVAKRLRETRDTLRAWRSDNEGPEFIRIGTKRSKLPRIRYRSEVIEQFLTAGEVKTTAQSKKAKRRVRTR